MTPTVLVFLNIEILSLKEFATTKSGLDLQQKTGQKVKQHLIIY